jgi:hypothetical protein
MSDFDASRARLHGPGNFPRFDVPSEGIPLARAGLGGSEDLMVVRRGGEARALTVKQMHWHHLAQGELAGEPYLVSF